MQYLFRTLLVVLLSLWLPALQAADSGWLTTPQNDHAQVRVRADNDSEGSTRVLLDIKLQDGWKTYWRSPGEGGIAPEIRWDGSPPAARWFWPVPQRFDVAGLTTQGYHHQVALPITMAGKVRDRLSGTLTLSTCSNVCILTDYPFSLDMQRPSDKRFAHDFAEAMGQVPVANVLTDTLQAGYQSGKLQITATRAGGWRQPELFIDDRSDASFGKPALIIKGDTLQAVVPVSDQWGEGAPDLQGETVSLVLADGGLAQQSALKIGPPVASIGGGIALWQVVLMALAGGFILNLMPCVLPVLGMKLGSILQVEQRNKRAVRLQFIASSAGIIASFMALALLMTVLRLSNHALGWGIQFQNPWFIGFMVLITLLFSANLFGLFYLRLPSSLSTRLATHNGDGIAGHFWQGAFATLLATPCSAPFLGTAVAFALAASLPMLWGIFIALGIGMSLPWLLIALFPALALKLPKAGRWMNGVRIAMGVMMLASCLWLVSLLFSHQGVNFTLMDDHINWQPLSEQAITDALATDKRVFIDVTADWCITCKANKFNVLMRPEVQQALQAKDVVALRGDWSRPSAAINTFLNRRGSVAVPFNQVYGPGNPQGTVLSPLLDRQQLLTALSDAKGKAK
jgi:suppressor for copper-sensitivity B